MTTARTRPIGWMVATAALAVCTVVLAVLLVVRSGSDEPVGATADSSARAACELIGQVPTTFRLSKGEGRVTLSQLGAATALAYLAKEQDAVKADFQERIGKPYLTAQRDFGGTSSSFRAAIGDARRACDEVVG